MDIEDIKKKLTPEQYNVCFLGGTEMPGSGKYLNNHEAGQYNCAICGQKLFSSNTKYDSQTGWPAFWDVADNKSVKEEIDTSFGMIRKNVLCSNCGSHLGHVFTDGPKEKTGLRYCINSLALEFKPKEK